MLRTTIKSDKGSTQLANQKSRLCAPAMTMYSHLARSPLRLGICVKQLTSSGASKHQKSFGMASIPMSTEEEAGKNTALLQPALVPTTRACAITCLVV